MEEELTWESLSMDHFEINMSDSSGMVSDAPLLINNNKNSNDNNKEGKEEPNLDLILPDDIIERIFSFLPVSSIIRVSSVCKRWHGIVRSIRQLSLHRRPVQKPWYFMFTCNESALGFAFDPITRKWYHFDLPCIEKSNWFVSSSSGLVCFMDNDSRSRVFVCNPITKDFRKLPEPTGLVLSDYSSISISVDAKSNNTGYYTVTLVKSKQVSDDFLRWNFCINVYRSDTGRWATPVSETFAGWRGGDDSIICNNVLYCLLHSTSVTINHSGIRHCLVTYSLLGLSVNGPPACSLMRASIPVPCALTCGRLMNLRERLVMVGGMAKNDRPDIIKGIGIWELSSSGREWRELARMPHKFFQGFGEFDDVFASSGTHDLIYIQSYGATALLVFDLERREWKWSAKCPVTKRFPLQLFTGFCFEPRLEVCP